MNVCGVEGGDLTLRMYIIPSLFACITTKLCNTGCNVSLPGFSSSSSPGPLHYFLCSFVAFWLTLNCKALMAGTTSFTYECNASDNGALAVTGAFGSACHRNDKRE